MSAQRPIAKRTQGVRTRSNRTDVTIFAGMTSAIIELAPILKNGTIKPPRHQETPDSPIHGEFPTCALTGADSVRFRIALCPIPLWCLCALVVKGISVQG